MRTEKEIKERLEDKNLNAIYVGLLYYGVWKLSVSGEDIRLSHLLEKKLAQEHITYRTTSQTGNDITFFLD